MKLTFVTADGHAVVAEAPDDAIVAVEVKQDDTDEFVMVRLQPRSLSVAVSDGAARTVRFEGGR